MKLELHQGAYEARSPIANAQVCINLVPENNPPDASFKLTHYPAPGLTLIADLSAFGARVRGLYVTSDGAIIVAVGTAILRLYVNPTSAVQLGSLASDTGWPAVSMCDNGTSLVIVDGSSNGYMVPLASTGTAASLQLIDDPAFYGSNRVDFIDTFLIFNWPGTPTFYSTTSNVVTPFDPLYFAEKVGWNDWLVSLCVLHDNIWLFGNATTEIWFNAGAADFPFARMPNSIIQQGCAAIYSVVVADNAVYWLSQDRWGHSMLMRGEGYAAKRVSNFAVENIWRGYPTVVDCVGMAYQIGGHETVGLYFPSANAWWGYDASTQMWHQRCFGSTSDAWLPFCTAYAGSVQNVTWQNVMLAGDRSSGRIFAIDQNAYTDAGTAIQRTRSWMHLQNDGQRVAHTRFSAAMVGTQLSSDTVELDWSDDGGQTYGAPVPQTVANQSNGQYQWRRLGYARDRVYRLQWSGGGECALNGAWIDTIPMET
jgi:hypothetical protein